MREFSGILLGIFGISVMQLILATAMPVIVADIGGESLYSWVFSSYMLASLFTIPIFAKLADIYGKKPFYMLGMGLFAVGTLYGGFAPSLEHLIGARVVQGLGAGVMIPVSLALISDLFPPERRANMIGIFGLVQLVANLVSPSLGGLITRNLGWHWIFLITVMVVVAAAVLVAPGKRPTPSTQSTRWSDIDLTGALAFGALCIVMINLLGMLSRERTLNVVGLGLMLGTLVLTGVLIWNERRHKNPVIKVEFFQTPILRRSIVSSVITGAIMYGLITILPLAGVVLRLHGVEMDEGQALFPFMLGVTIGILIGSRMLAKLKGGLLNKLLWGSTAVIALTLLYALSLDNLILFSGLNALVGFGTGGVMATFMINSQNAVSSEDRTVLSGLVQLGRYLGASIGVTLLTSLLPDVSQISGIDQFVGAFSLLVAMFATGFVNELV